MPTYTQDNRQLSVKTPLDKDILLLVGLTGQEAISQLFNFQLDLLAEDSSKVKFEKLLGQKITVTLKLPDEKERYFSGICNRLTQGGRTEGDIFTSYRMEIVPQLWLLSKRAQSRIFQHITVPDILKKVLAGLDVSFEIQGTFHPRDYCVQYRESDFNFASRLMEEEGIFYFFTHTADGHKMVVANTPDSHPKYEEDSQAKIIYEEVFGGNREENRILSWEKIQELSSGKYTLWDHSFELPHKKLEGQVDILESVQAGTVDHKLQVGNNAKLEIYDYPGAYAQRFDGVDKGGGDQSSDLSKIHPEDSERTTKIRMQAEAVPGLIIRGSSNCRHFVSGYQFSLDRHFDADGDYVLTAVTHSARLTSADYRSADGEFAYENHITCIPFNIYLPFRPAQVTVKPTVTGTQTAVVVGPQGEEIFTDKYGRVKVQFHWDREGKYDADSSCWIRVAQSWAGKKWGFVFIPRITMEVIVDFLEGDPDRPIIVGCVYNADMMPPYPLADEKTKSTIKTMSSKGGDGFNELRFEDKKGAEQVFVHGERDQDVRIKNDRREWIGQDRSLVVKRDKKEQVERDKHLIVKRDQVEQIERDQHLQIKGKAAIEITGSNSLQVHGDVIEEFKSNHSEQVTASYSVKAMTVVIEATAGITIKVGGNFITINPAGIQIVGMPAVMINSGGSPLAAVPGMLVAPLVAAVAAIADDAKPGTLAEIQKNQVSGPPTHDPASEENKDKKHWIGLEMVDEEGKPVAGLGYRVKLPDGSETSGTLDDKGQAKITNIDAGNCQVSFDLDKDAWEEA
jgi:type VI secretion system secreted protein VgrG